VLLSYECQPFRGYSKAIEAAPATTSGPSTRETTGPSSRETSGPSSLQTTEAGGGTIDTETSAEILVPGVSQDYTVEAGAHNHGIANGTRLALAGGGEVTFVAAQDHAHNLYNHAHEINLPPHTHGMNHTHQIDHTHGMDHTHQIPAHSHDIEFGIYEGPTPTSVVVKVDGNVVADLGTSVSDVDIIPYLSKDDEGKINRGAWHEITITPNNLGRIVATVNTQLFIQSRGGGNY